MRPRSDLELRSALEGGADSSELRRGVLAFLESEPSDARWHPYGFVKFPLTSDPSERISIHVWHPHLRRPQAPPHICHSHGWLLESTVIVGALTDRRYAVTASTSGEACLFSVSYEGDASIARKTSQFVTVHPRGRTVCQTGDTYQIPRDDFHTTELPGLLTVTAIRNVNDPVGAGCTIRSRTDPDVLEYRRAPVSQPDRTMLVTDTIQAIRAGP
jgi:hypothetical protein